MARGTQEGEMEMEVCGRADSVAPASLNLYEAQFFGFTPQTCMLRVCGAFQDSLCHMLEVVEEVCVRQLRRGASDQNLLQTRTKARESTRRLQQVLDQQFKKLWERMEALLLSRCFSIPPNVLLPRDQSHEKYPHDLQEVLRLESSMTELQKSYEAEVCARQALQAELEEQREVQKQLDGILEWISDLQGLWVKEGNCNFHESFRLAMESVKKLQEAVREVLICNRATS